MTLYVTLARFAPALASGLITWGIATEHAEPLALGIVAGVAALAELVQRIRRVKETGR